MNNLIKLYFYLKQNNMYDKFLELLEQETKTIHLR